MGEFILGIIDLPRWWRMTEPERVVAIIGRKQGVWISSDSMDYPDEESLRPIAPEVLKQLDEQASRAKPFVAHFRPWDRKLDNP